MTLLTVNNLSANFGGENVINNLSFKIDKGDYLIIVGENGAGKSTLLKVLSGLHSHEGNFSWHGLGVGDIGYLPQQNPIQKNFPALVLEIVLQGFCSAKGVLITKAQKIRAKELLEHIGLGDIINKPFSALSGGQQQRVLLARALVAKESVLLLDEPVASLDPKATEEMYKTVEHYNKIHGTTVIMVTHDISNSLKYANKVLKLGHDTFFGTVDEYKKGVAK